MTLWFNAFISDFRAEVNALIAINFNFLEVILLQFMGHIISNN